MITTTLSRAVVAASATLIALTGCTVSATPKPEVTVTEYADTAPERGTPDDLDSLVEVALYDAWIGLDSASQKDVCYLYNAAPSIAYDAFKETTYITRSQFESFFSQVC